MPQISDITINNGESTPVAKTFTPDQISPKSVAEYSDNSGGVAVGSPVIKLSNRKGAQGGHRVQIDVALPVLESSNGPNAAGFTPAATVAYTLRSKHEFILPSRSSKSTREDLLAFAKNILSLAVAEALIEDLQSVY